MRQKFTLRIGVIEDDQMLMAFMKKLIVNTDGLELRGAWMTGESALPEIMLFGLEVILLDSELLGISGAGMIPELGASQAGADGSWIKGCGPAVMMDGNFVEHRCGSPLSPEIPGLLSRTFHKESTKKKFLSLPHLLLRQRQILDQLAMEKLSDVLASEWHLFYKAVRNCLKQMIRSCTSLVVRNRCLTIWIPRSIEG